MKIKNRMVAIVIILILSISAYASITVIAPASAHSPPWQIPTFPYVIAAPSTIGVGQSCIIYMWLGNAAFFSATLYNDYRYHGYILTITAPDGTKTTESWSIVTDPTNSQSYHFTPTAVGTYILNFTYPGETVTASDQPAGSVYIGDVFLPSSTTSNLTVTQAAVPAALNSYPLPTAYWTRPIFGENTYWYSISSNWLGSGSPVESATGAGTITEFSQTSAVQEYPGDAVGPQTSHIMWSYPIEMGGVVGGNNFDVQGLGYTDGDAYSQRFSNPIIVDGYLYYTLPVSFTGSTSGATVCQDLQTGEIVWSSTQIPSLSFGYIYNLYDPNQHGVYPPILFTSNFARGFDAYTGDPLFNVTGVPSGTVVMGPNGEQLRYVLANDGTTANPQYYLAEWNSSRLWDTTYNPWTGGVDNSPTLYNDSTSTGAALTATQSQYAQVSEPAIGVPAGMSNNAPATYDYTIYGNVVNKTSVLYDYDWNVSLPWWDTSSASFTIVAAFYGNLILCRNGSLPAVGAWNPYTYFAINLNPNVGQIGSVLWTQTYAAPSNDEILTQGPTDPVSNVWVLASPQTIQWYGYSLTTGKLLWGPTTPQNPWDFYGDPGTSDVGAQVVNGLMYSSSFGGICYCYNDSTGQLLWTYGNGGAGNSTYSGFATNYGDYPTFIGCIGNGVIYLVTAEHTITNPIYKGALARAINATTGKELWTLPCYTYDSGTNTECAIADGFETVFNAYTDSILCIGRGPSATTVTAPDIAVPYGTPVVIKGTVIDTSAGTQGTQQKGDFPNGVPVASDASMESWMAYVYDQEPIPTNFTGVPVTISVTDSNHNTYTIGTATTTESGTYSLTWTPDIPGNFTVTATFAGTNGYWPSSAMNSFTVMSQPTSTSTPTPITSNFATTSELLMGIGALVVVIVIIGVAIILVLGRKRP